MSEALAVVREGFSKKEIKMAIGVASDPRYKQGNYTGAVNAIEKIKKGLSKHPQVAAVLKRQNEEVEIDEGKMKDLAIKIDVIAMKMKKDKTMKSFADKFKKDAMKTMNIKKSLEKVLPDYISGKDINALMTEGLDKEDMPKVKEIIKKLKGASQAHAGQAKDLQKAIDEEDGHFMYKDGKKVMVKTKADHDKYAKMGYTMKEDGHADVSSAMRQCKTITEDATEIDSKLQTMSPEDNLPTWWTNKLAVASNSMNKMRDYIVNPIQEETELDEMKEPFVVVDTADGDKVVGTASSEKGAKEIITTAQLPPMKIKDKKTLKIVKVKKKQMIGYPLKEGTWAVPETPAQKRDLKRLMSKPLPLGKEGDNAADKMYSIIGDDELFDDLYVAGKKDPEGDARPIIKKAMKRLKIKEDRWFGRDTWRLEESTKPDHIKVFNSLKKGDKVEINYDSSIAGGSTKTFVIKTKNKVYKGKVDKVTMYPDGKTGGVKFHLYQYDNRPGVYMAIGDMGASLRDIKKL